MLFIYFCLQTAQRFETRVESLVETLVETRLETCPERRDEFGQSTAEYALVIVAAAALAGLLISFLGQSSVISGIFGKVVSFVTKSIL